MKIEESAWKMKMRSPNAVRWQGRFQKEGMIPTGKFFFFPILLQKLRRDECVIQTSFTRGVCSSTRQHGGKNVLPPCSVQWAVLVSRGVAASPLHLALWFGSGSSCGLSHLAHSTLVCPQLSAPQKYNSFFHTGHAPDGGVAHNCLSRKGRWPSCRDVLGVRVGWGESLMGSRESSVVRVCVNAPCSPLVWSWMEVDACQARGNEFVSPASCF